MQRISHLLFVWMTGGAVNISEHPWRPSSASSAWRPGPSPWPAWPSWSPGWRRTAGAQRTSVSSPGYDIRTMMLKLTILAILKIRKTYIYRIGFCPREERKKILDCCPHDGVVCVLDSEGVRESLEDAIEVNSAGVMKLSLRMLISFQSTESLDCRQLTAARPALLSSCVLASPDTLTLTTADPAQDPGRRKFNLMLKHWNRDIR